MKSHLSLWELQQKDDVLFGNLLFNIYLGSKFIISYLLKNGFSFNELVNKVLQLNSLFFKI